jgi:outer membrane protein assembly factor BamB
MWRIVLMALILAMSGCTEVSEYVAGEEPIEPAELVAFKATLPVKLAWSTQLNPDIEEHEFKLKPVEIDGVVYIAEPQGRVSAYNAANGKLVWENLTHKTMSGGVDANDKLVLVGTTEAQVLELNRADGKIIWEAQVSSEVLSTPHISGKFVIVHVNDGRIIALDAQSGKRVWVYTSTVPSLSLRGTSAPLIWKDKVIAGFANGKLVALDLFTGKQQWEAAIAIPRGRSELERMVDIDAALRIKDGIIYAVSYQGRLAAVDAEKGQILWARDLSSYQDIALDQNQIYVTDNKSQVWALDRKSGATLWRQDKLLGRQLTGPTVQENYVVVGDFEGYVHWLARDDGRLVAREDLKTADNLANIVGTVEIPDEIPTDEFTEVTGIEAAPFAVNEMLYVVDKGGVLAAYEIGSVKQMN